MEGAGKERWRARTGYFWRGADQVTPAAASAQGGDAAISRGYLYLAQMAGEQAPAPAL